MHKGQFCKSVVEKMGSLDSDLRYMALNDLVLEFQEGKLVFDDSVEKSVIPPLLKLLGDNISEVKTMAVKALGQIIKGLSNQCLSSVIDHLTLLLKSKSDEQIDISIVTLKSLIGGNMSTALKETGAVDRLFSVLVELLENPNASPEVIDLVNELLKSSSDFKSDSEQLKLMNLLFSLLVSQRSTVRKRAVSAFSAFIPLMKPELFDQCLKQIFSNWKKAQSSQDYKPVCSLLMLLAAASKLEPTKISSSIDKILEQVQQLLQVDDDDVKESCFQILEALVLYCFKACTNYLGLFIELANEYSIYDPNYAMSEDEDEFEMDDDFDDYDEDSSWKVRKSSIQLVNSLIKNFKEHLPVFYPKLSGLLVATLKDREESVRIDCISTMQTLVSEYSIYSAEPPTELLKASISTLCSQLSVKSSNCAVATLELFSQFAKAKAIEPVMSQIVSKIHALLLESESVKSLKLSALSCLKNCFQPLANASCLDLPETVEVLLNGTLDSFYKNQIEALDALIAFIQVVSSSELDASLVGQIYSQLSQLLNATSTDHEVRLECILATSHLIFKYSNLLTATQINEFSNVLSLDNETIVATAIQALQILFNNSALIPAFATSKINQMLVGQLKKSERQIRFCALTLLESSVKYITADSLNEFIQNVFAYMNSNEDWQIMDKLMQVTGNCLLVAQDLQFLQQLNQLVVQGLLNDRFSAEATRSYWQNQSNQMHAESLFNTLFSACTSSSHRVAKAAAYVYLSNPQTVLIDKLLAEPNIVNLNILGEIGSQTDLSNYSLLIPNTIKLLENPDLCNSAATCLGNLVSGNIKEHLNLLVKLIQTTSSTQWLGLVALKQVLSNQDNVVQVLKTNSDLWTILLKTGNTLPLEHLMLVSECIYYFCLADPTRFTRELFENGDSLCICGLNAASMLVSNGQFVLNTVLQCNVTQTGNALVVKLFLGLVNTAAHHNPELLYKTLNESVAALIYEETEIRQDLIKTVEMGPFKHKVDEGLELRKAAFECLQSLVNVGYSENALDRLVVGLDDPAQEIRILVHSIFAKLALSKNLAPYSIQIADAIKKELEQKPKANAVKQEIERLAEIQSSAIKLGLVLQQVLRGTEADSKLNSILSSDSSIVSLRKSIEAQIESFLINKV